MEDKKMICTFKSQKKYFYDYFNANSLIQGLKSMAMMLLPVCVAFLIWHSEKRDVRMILITVLSMAFALFVWFLCGSYT